MTKKRVSEDVFIDALLRDLGDFKSYALDFCRAEVHDKNEKTQALLRRGYKKSELAHCNVSITKCFKGTPANASILSSLEYYSPALSAFACFKSAKELVSGDDWSTLFDAGVHYHFEWIERKKSVEAYTRMKRTGKADVDSQYKIIEAYLTDKGVTGYAIEKADIADKKTAENLLKQIKELL